MTIRLSIAQARALGKLDRNEPRSAAEIGETVATCSALVVAGYAKRLEDAHNPWYGERLFTKVREL